MAASSTKWQMKKARALTNEKAVSLCTGVDPTGDSMHIGHNSIYDSSSFPINQDINQ